MIKKPPKLKILSMVLFSSMLLPTSLSYALDNVDTGLSIRKELKSAIKANATEKAPVSKIATDDIAKATDDELINMPLTNLNSKIIVRGSQRIRVIESTPEKKDDNTVVVSQSFKPIAPKASATTVATPTAKEVNKAIVVAQPKPKPMPKFNLTLNQAPANEALMSLVVGTPYSMLVAPAVEGTISLNLKQVNLFEALDSIRELYGYTIKLKGNRIFVDAPKLETRLFYVDYLNTIRAGKSSISISSSSSSSSSSGNVGTSSSTNTTSSTGGGSTGTSGTSTGSASIDTKTKGDDFWGNIEDSLKMIVSNSSASANNTGNTKNISINYQTGIVIVRATADELEQVAKFLKRIQNSVERQVIIEAKIVEVQLNDEFKAGINWAMLKRNPNSNLTVVQTTANGLTSETFSVNNPSNLSSTMLGITFQTSNFSTLLTFLEAQGAARVLSSPRIATVNNQKAVLKVGKDIEYVSEISSNQTTTTGGVITNSTPNVSRGKLFSGIALDVTPQVDDEGIVTLHLHPAISEVSLSNQTVGGTTITLPTTQIRETDSVIRAEDGQVVAIGGLMRYDSATDESGIPLLKDLPVFGNLFKNRARLTNKSELVILLKPTIIKGRQQWQDDLVKTNKNIEEINEKDKAFSPGVPLGNP